MNKNMKKLILISMLFCSLVANSQNSVIINMNNEITKNLLSDSTQSAITTSKSYTDSLLNNSIIQTNFVDSIYFDHGLTIYNPDTITSNITIRPAITGKVPGYGAVLRVIGDGSHSITFTGFKGSQTFTTTAGFISLITFFYDGYDFWYAIKEQ